MSATPTPLPAIKDHERIEQMASNVLIATFGSTERVPIPVRIGEVAQHSEVHIQAGAFEHPDVSGMYERAKRTIYVDLDDNVNRQAFTIAHELGHHYLHASKDSEVYFRHYAEQLNFEDEQQEREANLFAACLLMPHYAVRLAYAETNDVRSLARRFAVSETAMYYRLSELNLPAPNGERT